MICLWLKGSLGQYKWERWLGLDGLLSSVVLWRFSEKLSVGYLWILSWKKY